MSEKTNHPSGAPWRNFYGRFRGKTLRDSQKGYLEESIGILWCHSITLFSGIWQII